MEDHKGIFSSLRVHLQAIEKLLTRLEHTMDVLSSNTLLKKELDEKSKEIRILNHIIDEYECDIHALKTKLSHNDDDLV